MFRSIVTAINFSRLKSQIKRQIPKTKNARKNTRVLPLATHMRMGSAHGFAGALLEETSRDTKSTES